jgi:hypothetical protein
MPKNKQEAAILAITAVGLLLGGCAPAARKMQQEPSVLPEPAFPSGRLGYPLGKYLTIEGVRAERGKVGAKSLLVDTVNGQDVSPPIGLWIDNVDGLPARTRCVLNGYESGKMIGLPREVAEKENIPFPQAAWQFYRYFIVTSVVEPKDLKKN